jgi:hypothetical protein
MSYRVRVSAAAIIAAVISVCRVAAISVMVIAGSLSATAQAEVLHTYSNTPAHEVVNVIAVDMAKLRPLVPPEYTLVPASSVLFGRPDQGVVTIANFQGFNHIVDQRSASRRPIVAIDIAILIAEPALAASVGLNIPGAFHLYALRLITDDAHYAGSLLSGGMPVEFFERIGYERTMDDATGVGDLIVTLPEKYPFLSSINTGQGYAPIPGAFAAAFWYDGHRGTVVLSFIDQPFRQGGALSRIYTRPNSSLGLLFDGGGLGTCPPDPKTRFKCILAPSLNLRYDNGTVGRLELVKPGKPGHIPFPTWVRE